MERTILNSVGEIDSETKLLLVKPRYVSERFVSCTVGYATTNDATRNNPTTNSFYQ